MPPCESYDGTGDPMEHLAHFTSGMNLHLVPDQIMCRAFPVTLKGAAHVWFQHLTPRSISYWAQLAESFRSNFLTSQIHRKNSSTLFRIVQGPKESLKSYYTRFNTEKLLIDNLDPGVTFATVARAEEDLMTTQDEGTSGQKRHDRPKGRIPEEPKRLQATLSKHFTPVTISREHILNQNKSQNILKWPKPMRMPADKRDAQLYYHFHKDHGHTTEECKVFQRKIENLIAKGHLKQLSRRMNAREDGEAKVKEGTRRSSADILFEEAFSQMQISRDQIRSVSSPLYGFTGASTPVEGVIPLTIVAGKYPLQATQSIDFLVVKVKSAYNGILGRANLNKLQAVASTFHPCMKFPTPDGIGVVKGDQAVARKCYMASYRVEEALAIEDQRDEHTFRRAEPVE
ncbi:hypothetical protein RJ639_009184 [Escallonia herrerae]|uniref:Retrotransposon gag domain-containing protein n=1 Tax=Escallonia herrerae TaxID=1293975 RepID=A0AA88VWS3_9ASTE|nr:hypothetical protein RJ639_009184 [Escallonia herrerae]